MSKLSNYFLKIRNSFQKSEGFVPRSSVNYKEAKHIGIMFYLDEQTQITDLQSFIQSFQKDNKYINVLGYTEKPSVEILPFECDLLSAKDISTFGQINSPLIERFVHSRFDYLYCVTTESFPLFDTILMKSQAKCRVGKYFTKSENHLDLMVVLDNEQKEDSLMKQMWLLTKKLTKND